MQGWELAVVAGVLLLLFGGSRLPKLARSLGEARTELEKVRKDAMGDDAPPAPAVPEAVAAAQPTAAPSIEVVSVVVADEVAAPAAPATPLLPPPLPPPGS